MTQVLTTQGREPALWPSVEWIIILKWSGDTDLLTDSIFGWLRCEPASGVYGGVSGTGAASVPGHLTSEVRGRTMGMDSDPSRGHPARRGLWGRTWTVTSVSAFLTCFQRRSLSVTGNTGKHKLDEFAAGLNWQHTWKTLNSSSDYNKTVWGDSGSHRGAIKQPSWLKRG